LGGGKAGVTWGLARVGGGIISFREFHQMGGRRDTDFFWERKGVNVFD